MASSQVDKFFQVQQGQGEALPGGGFGSGFGSGFGGGLGFQGLQFGAEGLDLGTLFWREGGQKGVVAGGEGLEAGGLGDFFIGEGAVVEAGAMDASGEAAVAAGFAMAAAEEDLAGSGFEDGSGRLAITAAIGCAVAITAHGAIGFINNGEVDDTISRFSFGEAVEMFAA